MHKDYFQGILQLRHPSKELITYVRGAVAKDRAVRIAKEERVTNGIDFYLTSNVFLRQLGAQLTKRFEGYLKTSATLHTRKRDKDIYRVTILFRLPHFKRVQRIVLRGENYEVVTIGKRVLLKELHGKKKYFRFDDVEEGFKAITSV